MRGKSIDNKRHKQPHFMCYMNEPKWRVAAETGRNEWKRVTGKEGKNERKMNKIVVIVLRELYAEWVAQRIQYDFVGTCRFVFAYVLFIVVDTVHAKRFSVAASFTLQARLRNTECQWFWL